jgi:chromosomal replication initiator protein
VLPHSFETFIVGRANALAREASLALAQGRQNGVSPLFLVGPPGNGKSHLAQAVITEARRNGIERGRHTSAESFTTELLSSIRSRQTHGFKRRFREQTDLLVVEDVQFFQGKASTQLELFHTLEHLRAVGARIVLTGDRLPRDIPKLDRRLSSQMSSGMVVEVERPDAELRRKLLIAKASAGGVRLPECCLDRLVDAVRGSVRDLEGALIQLVATASLLKRPIDLPLTEAALRKVADPRSRSGAIGVDVVIQTVAEFFGVSLEELCSRSRKRSILVPRQLAMFLSRRYTDASLAEIGRALGRDHPAVRNAIQVVERAILERAPLRYQIEELASRIERRRTGVS